MTSLYSAQVSSVCEASLEDNRNKENSRSSSSVRIPGSAYFATSSWGGSSRVKEIALPKGVSFTASQHRCFIVDGYVKVLDIASSSVMTVQIDETAESAAWSTTGAWLAIGDASGQLHFVLPSSGDVVLSKRVCKRADEGTQSIPALCFRSEAGNMSEELCVAAASGRLIRFKNIPVFEIEDGMSSADVTSELVQAIGDLAVSSVDISKDVSVSVNALYVHESSTDCYFIVAGSGKQPLSVWSASDSMHLVHAWGPPSGVESVSKVQCVTDPTTTKVILVVLDGKGTVRALDAHTMECLNVWDDFRCNDFAVSTSENRTVEGEPHVFAAATTPSDFRIFQTDWKTRSDIYTSTKDVPATAALVCCDDPSTPFLCAFSSRSMIKVTAVRLERKRIAPSHPLTEGMDELTSLLGAIKERAENGDAFDLDSFSDLITSVQDALEKRADDATFVATCCGGVIVPFVRLQIEIANIGMKLLGQKCSKEASEKALRIEEMLFRCDTFMLLSRSGSDNVLGMSWAEFCENGCSFALQKAIGCGDVVSCEIIWARHSFEDALENMSLVDDVVSALSSFPVDGNANLLLDWILTSVLPDAASACTDQVESWAARFAEELLIADPSAKRALLVTSEMVRRGVFPSIESLHRDLSSICYLAEEHKLGISLFDFQTYPKVHVLESMIEQVEESMLAQTVSGPVRACAAHLEIDFDAFLSEFAASQLSENPETAAAPVVVIHSISDANVRVDTLLKGLQNATSAQSKELLDMIPRALEWRTGRESELREQEKLVRVRSIIARYCEGDFNFANDQHVKTLLAYITSKVDSPTALSDALQLANTQPALSSRDVYVSFLENITLISYPKAFMNSRHASGETVERPETFLSDCVLEVLRTLPTSLAVDVGQELVLFCQSTVDDDLIEQMKTQHEDSFLKWSFKLSLCVAIAVLEFIISAQSQHPDCGVYLDVEALRDACRIVVDLFTECQTIVRIEDALSRGVMSQVFKDCVSRHFRAGSIDSHNLHRVADILSISPQQVSCAIAVEASAQGNIEAIERWSALICSGAQMTLQSGSELIKAVRHVALALSVYLSRGTAAGEETMGAECTRLIQILEKVLIGAVQCCSDEDLPDLLPLLQSSFVLVDAVEQCEIGNFETTWEPEDEQGNARRIHDRWFREDANVLSSSFVIPALTKLTVAQQRQKEFAAPNPALASLFSSVVKYLCDNRNLQLAMSVLTLLGIGSWSKEHSAACSAAVHSLAEKVLRSTALDPELSHGYLLALGDTPKAYSLYRNIVSTVKDDYNRLRSLARVGIDFAQRCSLASVAAENERMENNAYWWSVLDRYCVPFDHRKFNSANERIYASSLVPRLLRSSSFDVALCCRFANSYGVKRSNVHQAYIETLFSDSSVNIRDHESNLERVCRIIEESELVNTLESTVCSVPGTDYLSLRLLFRLLNTYCAPKGQKMNKYKRALQILDILQACELCMDFHDLVSDPWTAINPFLVDDKVNTIVILSGPLNIDADSFYARYIRKRLSSTPTPNFLTAVKPYLDKIMDAKTAIDACCSALEAYSDADERIAALEYTHAKAVEADDNRGGRLRAQLHALQTESSLKQLGSRVASIAKRFSNLPEELVCQLYFEFSPGASLSLPCMRGSSRKNFGAGSVERVDGDLHALVDAIAARHGFDAKKVRRTLVTNWLMKLPADVRSDSKGLRGGTIFHPTPEAIEGKRECLNDMRLLYLSSHDRLDDSEEGLRAMVVYLLNFVFQTRSRMVTFKARCRALRLLSILDCEKLVDEIYLRKKGHRPNLKHYEKYCVYMCELELVGFITSLDQLISCDKHGMARSLWRDHRQNSVALRLIARIIIDFRILDSKLLCAVLGQLNRLGRPRDVLSILKRASVLRTVSSAPELIHVWNDVLERVCADLDAVADDDDADVDRAFQWLLFALRRSSLAGNLDLMPCIRSCASADATVKYGIAIAMRIPNHESRDEALAALSASGRGVAVLDALSSTRAREDIFQAIYDSGAHDSLRDSAHFYDYLAFLVQRDLHVSLIHALRNQGKDVEANQLAAFARNVKA